MNGTTVYIYKESGKKWYDFKGSSTIEYNYYPLFLYQKYSLNWENANNSLSIQELLSQKGFQDNLEWYEKICLRLSVSGFYISKKSQMIALSALKKMEEEYPTSTENFPSFCRSMVKILSNYKLKNNEYIAIGSGSQGFNGINFPFKKYDENEEEILTVAKTILSNYDFHPSAIGKDICFDF